MTRNPRRSPRAAASPLPAHRRHRRSPRSTRPRDSLPCRRSAFRGAPRTTSTACTAGMVGQTTLVAGKFGLTGRNIAAQGQPWTVPPTETETTTITALTHAPMAGPAGRQGRGRDRVRPDRQGQRHPEGQGSGHCSSGSTRPTARRSPRWLRTSLRPRARRDRRQRGEPGVRRRHRSDRGRRPSRHGDGEVRRDLHRLRRPQDPEVERDPVLRAGRRAQRRRRRRQRRRRERPAAPPRS